MSEEPDAKVRRCAIYVRKSSEYGTTQELTSLQAQREVCSAFITSQDHRGWREIPKNYEDPGVSGATLQRPAMQSLMADIENGFVDIVIIYKLDRLSRSLVDFVHLLEMFDRNGVSFVCITQNFDTSDSLGRLVLNVLLTFAQFERELTADRIRDKKRLMSAKGFWPGGRPPLGYDLVSHRLVVNEQEAKVIKRIYSRYLELRSMKAVMRECRANGERSKSLFLRDGRPVGGQLLTIGTVRNILRNPIYKGDVKCGDVRHRGIHDAIVSEAVWTEAEGIRAAQIKKRLTDAPEDLLGGLSFDCFGRRLKPNRRYVKDGWVALYTSFQTNWARDNGWKRLCMNARTFEQIVCGAIHELLNDLPRLRASLIDSGSTELEGASRGPALSTFIAGLKHDQLRSLLHAIIERIEVSHERIKVQLRATALIRLLNSDGAGIFRRDARRPTTGFVTLDVPCVGLARMAQSRRIASKDVARRGRRHPRLVRLIKEMRSAQALADSRSGNDADLAAYLDRSAGSFRRLLRLNYLAPDIVAAILRGTQPPTLRCKDLMNSDLPLDWTLQRRLFGFAEVNSIDQAAAGRSG